MVLRFPAEDEFTGLQLQPGTQVVGVKLGGEWSFTAESIDWRTFKKVVEARLLSLDPEDPGLDHEDYALLLEFGQRYPAFGRLIGCEVPGLE